jgi:type VI secretion system protein ImpG
MPTDDPETLRYYQRELTYLRQAGADFAAAYPKIASRLELGPDECPDPHVERLLEGFAFLAGRIQHNIESEFPEITSALLGILYPHLLEPVPSMTIARFELDPEQGKPTTGHVIRKHTPLFTEARDGQTCRFRTCYPVTLWPVEVEYAGFESTEQFDFLDDALDVATVLRLRLRGRGLTLGELALDRLRFYLHGERAGACALYELLFAHARRVALLPEGATRPTFLPDDCLRPVGFGDDEDVLPYPATAHPGYRLLQEYFTFPDKYLFFDLTRLDVRGAEGALDVLILLDELPRHRVVVGRETFQLGCTPVINLFPKTTEPLRLDHRLLEYRLVPDKRRERTTEIHSILRVSASSRPEDETKVFAPFYSFTHEMEAREQKAFWHARRVPTGRADIPGTDVLLSFLDLDLDPTTPATQVAFAHTLCTNRRLAEQMPAGSLLQIEEPAPLSRIVCLAKPTRQLPPPSTGSTAWRLISALSLNYLSLADGREGIAALREILRLSAGADTATASQQIAGIRELACRRVVRHVGADAWRGFCRGFEITLTFDEQQYVGGSAFLLATVLNHFFGLYASVNSFTELVIASRQREGIWKRWPPIAGRQIVL